MRWIEPAHSKKQVQRAGDNLLNYDAESAEFEAAIPIFYNWRSAHAFPMQIMLDLLRKHAIKIDKQAIAVQRLKRVQSIFAKLLREKGMSLARMEDIAGCRVVMSDVRYVIRLQHALKKSRTKNILHRERDYLANPKQSGYRGVHLIYKYNGRKTAFNGMAVELQIRSRIQHSWATAVEVFGTYTRQALKASAGEEEWLKAFKSISVELAKLEDCPIPMEYENTDTFSEMKNVIEELNVFDRLLAFKVATKAITENKDGVAGYFIVVLDLEERMVRYSQYRKNQLDQATEHYNRLEEQGKNNPLLDVVMVSANSVSDLKRAYPNYFVDTSAFEKYLRLIYGKYQLQNSK